MLINRARRVAESWVEGLLCFPGRSALAISLVALLGLAVASYRFAGAAEEAAAHVRQSWQVRTAIQGLLASTSDAETALRGDLVGREGLEAYERAQQALPGAVAQLKDLLGREGWPAESADRVDGLVRAKLEILGALRPSPSPQGSSLPTRPDPALLDRSRGATDALRAELQAMEAEANRRLEVREHYQNRLVWGLRVVIAAAVCLGLLAKALAVLLWASLRRTNATLRAEIGERARAEGALRQAEIELEARLEARAAELTEANRRLEQELRERTRVERELERSNLELATGLTQLQRHNRATGVLSEMVDLLQSCLNVEEAASVVSRSLPRLLPGTSGSLALLKSSRNMVEVVASWGGPGHGNRVFAPDDCWALRRGQVHAVSDLESAPVCSHAEASPPLTCVPMTAHGELLGLLHLRHGSSLPDRSDPRGLMLTAAENIALALANLRLRESLKDLSIRDPLTGLFNRRYMEESLEREVRRATRGQYPLGIVMMDVDHFKTFNDAHGHAAGDALLRELGDYLRAFVRAEDIACRYGGEEFALILPDLSLDGTRQRAKRLREGVKHLHLKPSLEGFGGITLSLGVTAFPEHGNAGDVLIRIADAALYQAKSEGRDRVVVAHAPRPGEGRAPAGAGAAGRNHASSRAALRQH